MCTNPESKKLNVKLVDFKIFKFSIQLVSLKAFKDNLNMVVMLVDIGRKYLNVFKVNHNKAVKAVAEDVIHEMLEDSRGVGEPERHHTIFKMDVSRAKGGFPFLTRLDTQQVICATEVDFGEDLGRAKLVDEASD